MPQQAAPFRSRAHGDILDDPRVWTVSRYGASSLPEPWKTSALEAPRDLACPQVVESERAAF